jgi:drug/metabolite transporter (DMT)-like permease
VPRTRHPKLGYALAATAATLWAANGSISRLLLDDGVSAMRLSELRAVLTFVLLGGALAIARPRLLRIRREDLPRLGFLGIFGLAGVTATYFFAISRLDIGVALVIQYLGPLLVLLWLRVAHHRRLPRALWAAAALSLAGCFLVVEAWDPGSLDVLGIVAAFGAAVTFAIYLYTSEQAGHRYAPATILAWGFGFASVFWLIVQPIWSFPFDKFDSAGNIALGLGVAVVGTLVPFVCIVAALRHIPASRAAVVATLEPVLAAIIAWPVLGQTLDVWQILGGLLVVAAVVWVQALRPAGDAEAAPAYGTRRGESAAAAVR